MAYNHPLPAEFTIGAQVVSVSSYSPDSIPGIKPGKVTKISPTGQVTVEYTKGGTDRYVTDYVTKDQKSLTIYGAKGDYSSSSVRIHLAHSPVLARIKADANRKRATRHAKTAAMEFATQHQTVEAAEALIAQLQTFIASKK